MGQSPVAEVYVGSMCVIDFQFAHYIEMPIRIQGEISSRRQEDDLARDVNLKIVGLQIMFKAMCLGLTLVNYSPPNFK